MKPKYTVAQLIEELEKFPPEMPVIASGYEGEYENILLPKMIKVKFAPDEPYYNGQFHEIDELGENGFDSIVIERESRLFNI